MKITAYCKLLVLASLALLAVACGGAGDAEQDRAAAGGEQGEATSSDQLSTHRAEVDAWHAQRIERLQRPEGWLSLVGLHLLSEGDNRVGTGEGVEIQLPGEHAALVGTIHYEAEEFRFVGADGVVVTVEEEERTEVVMQTDGGGTGEPTVVQVGSLSFYVIERGGDHYLRSKDSESEVRRNFGGIDRYTVDEKWRVEARWIAFEEPKTVSIPNILGTSNDQTINGRLVFEIGGVEYELLPMGEPDQGQFVVFGDASNGVETYGGGRFLYTDAPGEGGTVIVDFNLAYNPPCVFTPYATCPLPPEGNTLPIPVPAGEKNWGDEYH